LEKQFLDERRQSSLLKDIYLFKAFSYFSWSISDRDPADYSSNSANYPAATLQTYH
jgi:hypothetical protein